MYCTIFCIPDDTLTLVLEEKAFHSSLPEVLIQSLTYYYVQCFYCQGRAKNLEIGSLLIYYLHYLYFHITIHLLSIFKSHSFSVEV